jgi:outer membrane receptor protein involved in Fe transport
MKDLLYVADARRLGASAALCAILGSGTICNPAWAATGTAAGAGDTSLAEIVVTAEKRDSTVQATAISLTAITGDQLLEQGTKTVEELVGVVPGVAIRTAGPGQTEYEMRGLGSSGGSTATVGFYLDETPLSASAVALNGRTVIDADLFDLNHAEVLRGPQGTLYGAGSMGGTIKLVTNPPKLGTFEGAAAVDTSRTTGGAENGGGDLMLNLPIGDKAALRFVTTGKYVSGWIDRRVIAVGKFPYPIDYGGSCNSIYYFCTRGDVQNAPVAKDIPHSNLERFFSTRAVLLAQPTDQLSMTGTFMYQKINADGYNNYQAPPLNNTLYQPYDIQEPFKDLFKLVSLKVVYNTDIADFTSSTSYWKRDQTQTTDSTEAIQNIFNLTTFIPNLYQDEDVTTQIAEELRVASKGTGAFNWVAGIYITDLHSGYVTTNQNPAIASAISCTQPVSGGVGANSPLCNGYNPNYNAQTGYGAAGSTSPDNPNGIIFNDNNPNVTKQQAIFGETSYKFTDALKLTTGLRFYKFTVANRSYQTGLGTATGNQYPACVNGTGPPAAGGNGTPCIYPTATGKGSGVLPKINLSYEPTSDLTLYGTIAKGSRPGGVNLPIPITAGAAYYCGAGSGASYLTSQPNYYGPDNIWSFEIGEKARFNDRRFSINADLFYVKWSDIQQLIVLTCGYPYNDNVGSAKSYGPEVEFSAKVTDGLTIGLTGAYTQAYINDPISRPGLPLPAGTRVNNIPRYTGDLSFDYETTLQGDFKLIGRLNDSYVGATDDVAYYRETLGGYMLLDARLGIAKDAWSAFLYGANLNNKHAALTIDNTVFAWQQPTITRVSTNQPRTVGIQAQIKF